VVTIHDLNYRLVPDAHFGIRGLGMRLLVPLAARRSDRIIAVSGNTRDDLERLLHISPGKVDVVPHGTGSDLAQALPEDEIRGRLDAGDRPVVLSVSAKRPSKNLLRLIGALSLIPSQRRPLLVIPGYPTPYEAVLRDRAQAVGVKDDLRLLGWVSPGELEGLYAVSRCFVFPSLYEGFGFPVLEAMRRGVPVACSDRGSLSEVAGDAALYFDPMSEPSIAQAIQRLLADAGEAERLRSAGRARASRFTWEATAAGTLASYDRAASRARDRGASAAAR
jgi:glycosyltransferase involved in cell wall biosynthesis